MIAAHELGADMARGQDATATAPRPGSTLPPQSRRRLRVVAASYSMLAVLAVLAAWLVS